MSDKTFSPIEIKNPDNSISKNIDLSYLNKLTKSAPHLMMEMISLYLAQTPPLFKVMHECLKSKDWDTLHKAIHKMIPSFSIMGINSEFEQMALQIQASSISRENLDEINSKVIMLEKNCKYVYNELELEYERLKLLKNIIN